MSEKSHISRLLTSIDACKGRLLAFIRSRAPRDDVEDILQDITYRLLRTDSFAQPVENVAAWLYRAAQNEIIDRGRKKKTLQLPETISDHYDPDNDVMTDIYEVLFGQTTTPEEEYLHQMFWIELELALDELSDQQREAFIKTELEGYSLSELSNETGISVNTLSSRKHKAMLVLRTRLEGLYQEIFEL